MTNWPNGDSYMYGASDGQPSLLEVASIPEYSDYIPDYRGTEYNTHKKETVNHPEHYNPGVYEVINIIEHYKLGFHLGNSVKYILRAGKKHSDVKEDIEKAIWYLQRYKDSL